MSRHNGHQDALTSIPNEIILYIIKIGTPSSVNDLPNNLPEDLLHLDATSFYNTNTMIIAERIDRKYLTHLCAVDRRIRNLILGDPSFWRKITIRLHTDSEEVCAWIKRSRNQPLDLRIILTSPHHPHSDPSAPQSPTNSDLVPACTAFDNFESLKDKSNRWDSLIIITSCEYDMSHFAYALSQIDGAPLLRRLKLLAISDCEFASHSLDSEITPAPFMGSHPLLTDVMLSGSTVFLDVCETSSFSSFNSHFLCNILNFSDVNATFLRINSIASTLTRLSITTFGFQNLAIDHEPIHFPRLQHLDITFWAADELVIMLPFIKLPQLRVLGIIVGHGESNLFWDQIYTQTGDLPRLFHQITTLITSSFPMTRRRTTQFLRLFPRLINLVIRSRVLDGSEMLRHLSMATLRNTPLCPKLENVLCIDALPTDIRNLIIKRQRAGIPLNSFHIGMNNSFVKTDLKWISQNVKLFIHPKTYLANL